MVGIDIQPPANGQPAATRGEIVPDLKQRFVLTYANNPFFYDRYCILTTPNGLLSSVEYATEDKTPQIALALSELAGKLRAGGFVSPKPLGVTDTEPVTSATVTFNPFDKEDREAAAQVVNNTFGNKVTDGFGNRVNVQFHFPDLGHFSRFQDGSKCRGDKGLCFRTKVKTPLQLRDAATQVPLTTSVLVDVVNPYYVGHFELDRAFMVEKVVRLGFENGALNQVIMRKPSEVLQTVKLPIAVVDAILTVPANFISNTTGSSQAIADKLREQRLAIKAIQDQLVESGVADSTTENIYRPKCYGRTGLFNPPPT